MSFKFEIERNPDKVNFHEVAEVLHKAGLSRRHDTAQHEKAFRNSDITIFIKDNQRVIGVGRALSDFVSQGAIYNIAVDPDYQGQHVGHTIITELLKELKGQNVILYTHPQTLTLYEKYNFRRNKTAFAHFEATDQAGFQWMEDEGFFLPENFRFESEQGRY